MILIWVAWLLTEQLLLQPAGLDGDVTLVNDEDLDFATSSVGGDLNATATIPEILPIAVH